jgi:hypothetical protein
MTINQWAIAALVVLSLRMTWTAAYSAGRDSVFDAQQVAEELQANCYAKDKDCSDQPKKKGVHHELSNK